MGDCLYSSLLCLLLVLLIVNLAPQAVPLFQIDSKLAFLGGLAVFLLIVFWIALQGKARAQGRGVRPSRKEILVQSELIFGLILYHFIFAGHVLYEQLPWLGQSGTLFAGVSLFLYFWGLWVYEYAYRKEKGEGVYAKQFAWTQTRFLMPFILPFIFFELFVDVLIRLPIPFFQKALSSQADPLSSFIVFSLVASFFLLMVVVFFPLVVQRMWKCTSLPESPLRTRLEQLCRRSNFRCRDLMLWTVMPHQVTAAIIGVVARYRYILFTPTLLDKLSPEEVEAVLAHEIGHNYRRHLLIYPFVMVGLVVVTGFFSLFFGEGVANHFALKSLIEPNRLFWEVIPSLGFLILLGTIVALYFRYVFGYFSRTFERQADLHIFQVGVPAEHMIGALASIGFLTGERADRPNWHHYSVKQRMDFLHQVAAEPHLAVQYHRRTKDLVRFYFLFLILSCLLLLSPDMQGIPVIGRVGRAVERAAFRLEGKMNDGLREKLAGNYSRQYQLDVKDSALVKKELFKSLKSHAAIYLPGVAELLAAHALYEKKEYRGSLVLMAYAWKRFDFTDGSKGIVDEFYLLSQRLLQATSNDAQYKKEVQNLEDAIAETEVASKRNGP